jgi:hypothetical protein
MKKVKADLLEWLKQARTQVLGCAKTQLAIKKHNEHVETIWHHHKHGTDIETGVVDSEDRTYHSRMVTAMNKLQDTGNKLHVRLETWPKHVERKFADEAWEDFHYYQNVWNRRYFDPTSTYFETKSEKDAAKKNEKCKPQVVPIIPQSTRINVALKSQDDFGDYAWLYCNWRNHMINLYIRFKLGYRKQIPEVVSPEDAHRYSQPPRGTIKRELELYDDRHKHLEVCFPRRRGRRNVENGSDGDKEVEENYPPKDTFEQDEEAERRDHMDTIAWYLDDKAVNKLKLLKEEESSRRDSKASEEETTEVLVPVGHVLHHGSLETSFYWPTAFDAADQDNIIGLTINRKRYLYENVSNVRALNKKEMANRTNEKDGQVKKVEEGTWYHKVQSGTKVINGFQHDLDSEGNVLGRDRDNKWRGRVVTKTVPRMVYERVRRTKRVPLSPRYQFFREFGVRSKTVTELQGSRRENLKSKRKMNEISDDEEEDCTKENRNFEWSGNANANEVGANGLTNENGQGKMMPGGRSNGEDEESDDEGDLFRQSYEECSGTSECPLRRKHEFYGPVRKNTMGRR